MIVEQRYTTRPTRGEENLDKKVRKFLIEKASITGEVLTPEELEAEVLAHKHSRQVYKVGDFQTAQIVSYVWERGLLGTGSAEYGPLLKGLHTELQIENRPAIQDKVNVSTPHYWPVPMNT